jgi:hypothetical protein
MRSLSLVLIAATLASCTTSPPQQLVRSDRAEAQLRTLVAGRAVGKPQSCLPNYRSTNLIIVDDGTAFYRSGAQLFRQDFQGGRCRGLASSHYALVTRQFGGSLCRGDIAQVMDTSTGMSVGSCVIGDFVPYSRIR